MSKAIKLIEFRCFALISIDKYLTFFRAGPDDGNYNQTLTIEEAYDPNRAQMTLEDFELIEKLGKGSFGSVFLVKKKDDPTGRFYAMKILEKDKVFQQNLLRYAKTEKNVLMLASHPFIVGLHWAFQSPSRLYLIMQYCPGGDMGMALAKDRRFSIDTVTIYAAEIVLALEYLHNHQIIFRDLKPDNVIFDEDGHALLTDFGLSKQGIGTHDQSSSFCGSVAYLAPEMLRRSGHARSIDWYLLGVLIYEMLVGVPPYFNTDKSKLFENIQQGPLKIPHTMTPAARTLILSLLNRNPTKRLGSGPRDAEEIKEHDFFAGINWEEIQNRKGNVKKPKPRMVLSNPKSIKTFLEEEKESLSRFANFEKTNPKMFKDEAHPERIAGWSFVASTPDDLLTNK